MIQFPNAKINIGLNVTEKRSDGFHNIESILFPVPIKDILEINRAPEFTFTTSGLNIKGGHYNNLIIKAYKLMRAHYNISPVGIHLHKLIPMGAGIGGGSADASATIKMLNTLFDLNLMAEKMMMHAAELGSDCPFFIKNTPHYVTGMGDVLEAIELNLEGYYLKVINPGIHISTKEAYANIVPRQSDVSLKELIKSPINEWKDLIKNDFEAHLLKVHPLLPKIKTQFYNEGAIYASMSGSGSTMFGLFKDEPVPSNQFIFETLFKI